MSSLRIINASVCSGREQPHTPSPSTPTTRPSVTIMGYEGPLCPLRDDNSRALGVKFQGRITAIPSRHNNNIRGMLRPPRFWILKDEESDRIDRQKERDKNSKHAILY
ncbi:hypothetical protein EVAR_13645_1 [Eumeta japonica]|uniref:Uncharacterized protein n=1 Tax=Eumeta variegata TaxID=151549 RepID=A0A4C1UUQ7_EUMVA|nr:hypothetical protein EVAR_13645_1 [Eumeta japonica]